MMASATYPITVASDGTATEAAVSEVPTLNYTSVYVSSILAVSMLFLVAVGVPLALYLNDWGAGMGIGAFTAFWGGPSFGTMVGSARTSAWDERHGTDDH